MKILKYIAVIFAISVGVISTLMMLYLIYQQSTGQEPFTGQPLDLGSAIFISLSNLSILIGGIFLIKNKAHAALFLVLSVIFYAAGASYSLFVQLGFEAFIVIQKTFYLSIMTRAVIFSAGIFAMFKIKATNNPFNNGPESGPGTPAPPSPH